MTDPMDDCAESGTVCDWNDDHSDRWVAAVDREPWQKLSETEWLKSLDCPRCGHAMNVIYEIQIVLADVIADFRERFAEARDVDLRLAESSSSETHPGFGGSRSAKKMPVRCNCRQTHKNQPTGDRVGCGQFGLIAIPRRD